MWLVRQMQANQAVACAGSAAALAGIPIATAGLASFAALGELVAEGPVVLSDAGNLTLLSQRAAAQAFVLILVLGVATCRHSDSARAR